MSDALYSVGYVGAVEKEYVLAEGGVGVMTHVPCPWYALLIVGEFWHRFDAFDCKKLPLPVWLREAKHIASVKRSDDDVVTVAR